LELNLIRRYGRQILDAMHYLSSCGIIHYHLHTGNVIIGKDGDIYLCNIENNFLGFLPRHPYHKYLVQLKKLYPELVVELCLFGYVVFEMASGIQCPGPSPLDCLHELPKKLPPPVVQLLGKIFGDKSVGAAKQISDLLMILCLWLRMHHHLRKSLIWHCVRKMNRWKNCGRRH